MDGGRTACSCSRTVPTVPRPPCVRTVVLRFSRGYDMLPPVFKIKSVSQGLIINLRHSQDNRVRAKQSYGVERVLFAHVFSQLPKNWSSSTKLIHSKT
jgi:hypothetical protein